MAKQTVSFQKALGSRIQKLRQDHGYSQEELAVMLGVSRQAVGQMEKGERCIDARELAALSNAFAVSTNWLLQHDSPRPSKMPTRKKHQPSFDQEKFRQTLLYVLSVCGGKANVGETVLYKLLYFIDFNAFEVLGKPVTGMPYVKMQYGPVPLQTFYRKAIDAMVEKKELKIFSQEYYGMLQKRYVALADPNMDVFSIREKEVMDGVLRQLADFSARKIADYAHGDAPWMIAEDGEMIQYEHVIERHPPYAQLDHWLSWQDAGAADVLKYLPPLTKEEKIYYEGLRP